MVINRQTIDDEYHEALGKCFVVLPIERWSIKPIGFGYTTHKTKYGKATKDGIVLIGEHFIGTTAINKLRETIVHELAHLAVGLKQNHNDKFKRVLSSFGGGQAVSDSDYQKITDNIKYKYSVSAHFVDGSKRVIGGSHRKTKKYTEYQPAEDKYISVNGIKVARFEYIEN